MGERPTCRRSPFRRAAPRPVVPGPRRPVRRIPRPAVGSARQPAASGSVPADSASTTRPLRETRTTVVPGTTPASSSARLRRSSASPPERSRRTTRLPRLSSGPLAAIIGSGYAGWAQTSVTAATTAAPSPSGERVGVPEECDAGSGQAEPSAPAPRCRPVDRYPSPGLRVPPRPGLLRVSATPGHRAPQRPRRTAPRARRRRDRERNRRWARPRRLPRRGAGPPSRRRAVPGLAWPARCATGTARPRACRGTTSAATSAGARPRRPSRLDSRRSGHPPPGAGVQPRSFGTGSFPSRGREMPITRRHGEFSARQNGAGHTVPQPAQRHVGCLVRPRPACRCAGRDVQQSLPDGDAACCHPGSLGRVSVLGSPPGACQPGRALSPGATRDQPRRQLRHSRVFHRPGHKIQAARDQLPLTAPLPTPASMHAQPTPAEPVWSVGAARCRRAVSRACMSAARAVAAASARSVRAARCARNQPMPAVPLYSETPQSVCTTRTPSPAGSASSVSHRQRSSCHSAVAHRVVAIATASDSGSPGTLSRQPMRR